MLLTNGSVSRSSFCFDNISSNWLADWLTSLAVALVCCCCCCCSLAGQALFGSRRDKARIKDQYYLYLSCIFELFMPTDQIAGTNPTHVLQSLVCVTKITLMLKLSATNITSHCFYDQQKVEAVKHNLGIRCSQAAHVDWGNITHCFSLFGTSHTRTHTHRDDHKEWIYELVICEKAKPPLNRRHSNSFFFLSK